MLVGFTIVALMVGQAEAAPEAVSSDPAPVSATAESTPVESAPAPTSADYGYERQDIEDLSMADMLDVVISTATKVATPIEKTPAISRVITRRELDRMGVRMLSEVLGVCARFLRSAVTARPQFPRCAASRGSRRNRSWCSSMACRCRTSCSRRRRPTSLISRSSTASRLCAGRPRRSTAPALWSRSST